MLFDTVKLRITLKFDNRTNREQSVSEQDGETDDKVFPAQFAGSCFLNTSRERFFCST